MTDAHAGDARLEAARVLAGVKARALDAGDIELARAAHRWEGELLALLDPRLAQRAEEAGRELERIGEEVDARVFGPRVVPLAKEVG